MNQPLSKEDLTSLKKSYYNIYALFLKVESISGELLNCIYKWGLQLGISKDELHFIQSKPDSIQYEEPANQIAAIEHVYDMVYMIYLDGIVEDVELEVTMKYAEKLGFKPHIVGDLLKAIVTSPHIGEGKSQVRHELSSLLEATLTDHPES